MVPAQRPLARFEAPRHPSSKRDFTVRSLVSESLYIVSNPPKAQCVQKVLFWELMFGADRPSLKRTLKRPLEALESSPVDKNTPYLV